MTDENKSGISAVSVLIALSWVALITLAVAAYQTQRRLQGQWQDSQQEVARLRAQIVQLTTNNSAAMNALASAQTALQQKQADLEAVFVGGAQKFADAQRQHAAEYLIREAEQMLLLSQDIPAAIRALDMAQRELEQGSKQAGFAALQKALRSDLQKLREFAGVDALAVARSLSQALTKADQLQTLQLQLGNEGAARLSEADVSWLGHFQQTLREFSGDWFLVRHYGHEVEAPLTAVENRQIQQALKLALANAQAAALRHEQGLYYNALQQALNLVKTHYGNSRDGESLEQELIALSQRLVSVNANLSLQSASLLRGGDVSA